MKDTVILFSGGLDSTVLLYAERERIKRAIYVEYAQPAGREEGLAATLILDRADVPMRSIHASLAGIDAMQAASGEKGARIVPARNLVLLAYGVNLALSEGCTRVIYGATGGDVGAYADCRASFVTALSSACRGLGCSIEAPFLGMSKAEVVAKGREIGAPLEMSWSCYAPRFGAACGGCNACVERAAALG
jgi:7-cyano-7-deazaguanine synthase